jgi:uncharacterized protein
MSAADPGAGGPVTPASSDSRAWAVAAQLTPLLGLSFLGPLIIWLIKREEDPFVEGYAREALNFQISVLIYGVAVAITIVGLVLLIPLAIFAFIAAIVAAVRAANGEAFRYPLTIRLISP